MNQGKKDSAQEKVEITESQIERVEGEAVPGEPKKGFKGLLSKLKPGAKREAQKAQMQTIQTGYQEVVGLVRSVREHLDRQENTQARLIESMETLPEALAGLKHLSEATEQQKNMIEQHRQATEQQKEMLGVIKGQMENSAEHSQNITGSMDRFNDTLFSMDNTTRRIAEGARASEDTLRDLVERSEKRFFMVSALMGVLILGLAGILGYMGMNGFGKPEPVSVAQQPDTAPDTTPKPAVAGLVGTPVSTPEPVPVEPGTLVDPETWAPGEDPEGGGLAGTADGTNVVAELTEPLPDDVPAATNTVAVSEIDPHAAGDRSDTGKPDSPEALSGTGLPAADPDSLLELPPKAELDQEPELVPVEKSEGIDVELLKSKVEALLNDAGEPRGLPKPQSPKGIDPKADEKLLEPPKLKGPAVPLRGLPSIFPNEEEAPVEPDSEDQPLSKPAGE